jgi:hypothetical protein
MVQLDETSRFRFGIVPITRNPRLQLLPLFCAHKAWTTFGHSANDRLPEFDIEGASSHAVAKANTTSSATIDKQIDSIMLEDAMINRKAQIRVRKHLLFRSLVI